jgi:hypothetical protein
MLFAFSVQLYDSKHLQEEFHQKLLHFRAVRDQIEELRRQYQILTGAIDPIRSIAEQIVSSLGKVPVHLSLWRHFELDFQHFDSVDSFKIRLRTKLMAALPFQQRVLVGLEHFGLTSKDFDEVVRDLDSASNGSIFQFQDVQKIVSHSASTRPSVLIIPDSTFLFSHLLHVVNPRLVESSLLMDVVADSVGRSGIVCTFCESDLDLINVLSPISFLSKAEVHPEFCLLICSMIDCANLSLLFLHCNLFYLTTPFNLRQFGAVVGDEVWTYHAVVSLERHFRYSSPLPSYSNIALSLQCFSSNDEIKKYISRYVYETELFSKDDRLLFDWQVAVGELELLESPSLFGLPATAFDLCKQLRLRTPSHSDVTSLNFNPIQEILPRFMSEFKSLRNKLNPNRSSLFIQLFSSTSIVDLGLLIYPHLFIEVIKFEFFQTAGEDLAAVVVRVDEADAWDQKSGAVVKGLIVLNARFERGKFRPAAGALALPPVWLRPGQADGLTEVGFYHMGMKRSTICLDIEGSDDEKKLVDVMTVVG